MGSECHDIVDFTHIQDFLLFQIYDWRYLLRNMLASLFFVPAAWVHRIVKYDAKERVIVISEEMRDVVEIRLAHEDLVPVVIRLLIRVFLSPFWISFVPFAAVKILFFDVRLQGVNPPSTKVEGFQHCVLKKAQRLL